MSIAKCKLQNVGIARSTHPVISQFAAFRPLRHFAICNGHWTLDILPFSSQRRQPLRPILRDQRFDQVIHVPRQQ